MTGTPELMDEILDDAEKVGHVLTHPNDGTLQHVHVHHKISAIHLSLEVCFSCLLANAKLK